VGRLDLNEVHGSLAAEVRLQPTAEWTWHGDSAGAHRGSARDSCAGAPQSTLRVFRITRYRPGSKRRSSLAWPLQNVAQFVW